MRNLKKFLALVLAMAMAFSLMLSASAATFDDKHFSDTEEVTQAFKEAVAVLTGLDVIKGDGDGDLKTIRPQSDITRAEAAALVYRIATGDINDKQVDLYSDYSNFTDVKPKTSTDAGDWFAGYVGYCQNAGIIKGTTPTTFNPYGKVTGYEVLAMILRAVGYGKNNEFTGSSWQVNVASLAKTKHITDSISSAQYNYSLNMNARREIVAELLFRGSMIPQVRWTPGLGYVEYENGQLDRTSTLAGEVFGLRCDGWGNDKWGRPQIVWKASLNPTSSPARTVATLKAQPKESFHDEKRECDVAELMELGTAEFKDYILYVNNGGTNSVTKKYHIVAADTVTKVGGYGRLTEIYTQDDMNAQFPWHNTNNYWAADGDKEDGAYAPADTIVMIDTVVAKVITVNPAVLDTAGHVITPARMTVDLYDAGVNQPTRRTISKPATSKDNWEFSTGDVLSLNGFTPNSVTTAGAAPYNYAKDENDAFITRPLPGYNATTGRETSALVEGTHVENIQKMSGVQGKQTVVYRNTNQHQVDGKDYFDDLTLKMDKALQNTNTTYTWYYDQYGYVQAIDDGGKVNYGVITAVYAAFAQGETQTTGTAKAIATVRYADGTTGTEEISYFLGSAKDVDTYTPVVGGKMTDNSTAAGANVVQLWPQYDIRELKPMEESDFGTGVSFSPARGEDRGIISMAPVAASNQYTYTDPTCNKSGILHDHLWKFVKTTGDVTVAIEVAGGGNDYTVASTNTGDFAGHWNATNTGGKLYKNQAYITTANAGTGSNVVAWLDDDTQIMVRNPASNAIVTYDGVSALPGDVTIPTADSTTTQYLNQIDWADTDNDGRADVVYLSGTIDGLTTYGLFYFGGTSSWDGTTGSMQGWLNGEAYTLTTGSLANYNVITNAAYNGHLFAVQLFNGALQNIMEAQNQKGSGQTVNALYDLSANDNTSGTVLAIDDDGTAETGMSGAKDAVKNIQLSGTGWTNAAANLFHVGNAHGNPYNAKTEAVYYLDSASASNTTDVVTFNANGSTLLGSTVQVWRDDGDGVRAAGEVTTYHLTPNSKVYGIGTGVTSGFEALEYLNRTVNNKVTIVYENEGNTSTTGNDHQRSILEIYVVTDNDNTPATQVGRWLTPAVSASAGSLTVGNLGHGGNNNATYNFTVNVYMTTAQGATTLIATKDFTNFVAGSVPQSLTARPITVPNVSGYVYRVEVVSGETVVASNIAIHP